MTTSQKKLTVLQIISNLDIGGAQEVVRTLVKYLASDSCVPVVCSFKDGPLRQDIERMGIQVELLPVRRRSIIAFPWFVADVFRIWRELRRLVKKHNVEIVQTHLLRSLDFLVLLLRFTTPSKAIFWTFHNANFELTETQLSRSKWLLKPKIYAHRWLYLRASSLVQGFIAVSDEVKNAMLNVIGPIQEKITVICNGVDVSRYGLPVDKTEFRRQLQLDADSYLIAVVATLKEQKGHRYLVEAMSHIVPHHPNLHTLFIGDGPLHQELQDQVDKLNLTEHIHLLGNRYDIPSLLAASDLFVLPSLWEGLPMALLEAMATGLPIIATEVSGTIQVILPNETGLLVPPGNTERLVEAIQQLLSEPVKARAMGDAAQQRVEELFSASKQANEHLELYHRFLNGPSR